MREPQKYKKTYVAICRNCNGNRVTKTKGFDYGHGHEQEPKVENCNVCDGEGLVEITKETTVTIKPKKNELIK